MDLKSKAAMDRLLDGMKASAEELAPIIARGHLAVFIFEPGELALKAATMMGWDGRCTAFRPHRKSLEALARNLDSRGDRIAARWLRSKHSGRIFVLMHEGTLCVNYSAEGFAVEPGTLDQSWMN